MELVNLSNIVSVAGLFLEKYFMSCNIKVYVGKYGEDDRFLTFEKPYEITKCTKQVVLYMVILGKHWMLIIQQYIIMYGQPVGIDR